MALSGAASGATAAAASPAASAPAKPSAHWRAEAMALLRKRFFQKFLHRGDGLGLNERADGFALL